MTNFVIPNTEEVSDIVTEEKINWAIQSFDSYKSPGLDGIIPKMLQSSIYFITPILNVIYRNCLRLNYIQIEWRNLKVVFVPRLERWATQYQRIIDP